MLERFIVPLLQQGADTLVLGCTHYPFVLAAIERIVADHAGREVVLVDTGHAVARQLARLLTGAGTLNPSNDTPARLQAFTTGGDAALRTAFSTLLGLEQPVSAVAITAQIAVKTAI
jgi:glutamate racemase